MTTLTRRSFLKDMLLLCAAPAIVKIESIMPVKPMVPTGPYYERVPFYSLGTEAMPLSLTKENILEYMLECQKILDEQNVPTEGRVIYIPDWVAEQFPLETAGSDIKAVPTIFLPEDSIILSGKGLNHNAQ